VGKRDPTPKKGEQRSTLSRFICTFVIELGISNDRVGLVRGEPESSYVVEPQKEKKKKESNRVAVSCTFVNHSEKNRAKNQESRVKNGKEARETKSRREMEIDRAVRRSGTFTSYTEIGERMIPERTEYLT
jgi:hypothetical protein